MPTKKKPAKAPVKKVVAKPAKKAPAKKVKRKLNPALMKPIQPDAMLALIVGSKPLPRSQMTKNLWDYIKKNKLQDPKKRTLINADDALKAVFGGKKHFSPIPGGPNVVAAGDFFDARGRVEKPARIPVFKNPAVCLSSCFTILRVLAVTHGMDRLRLRLADANPDEAFW